MEFDLLFKAMHDGDDKAVNEHTPAALGVMIAYLRFNFDASQEDAEDCAQDTIVKMMDFARDNDVLPENAGGYARKILKNYYLKTYRASKKLNLTENSDLEEDHNNPYEIFIDNEMKRLLNKCIEKLDEFHTKLIRYIFKNPDERALDVGKVFNLSESNVWVKRHRIQKQLQECVQKNI